ncbi:hypothetical protein CHK_2533 [Christensenella hongkongensis]|uniref:Uncharacterized protein n=1 Tax=Christensenella hongkongensis TaxID=270498 RepID=A0A0M2NHK6_9FIRM|nr:hypothetical protein CHK_2533 [Christensenella hongkongensis]
MLTKSSIIFIMKIYWEYACNTLYKCDFLHLYIISLKN